MTAAPTFAPTITLVRGLAGLRTMLHRFGSHWQRVRAQRRKIARITRELQGHTNRQLGNLGLSRADIPDVARRMFRTG
jgi:uncharacterized protein YjiS (DUF1127 family)